MRKSKFTNIFWMTMMALCLSQSARAGQVTVTLPQIALTQNENDVFGVSLTNADNLAGGQITLTYDSTIGFDITGVKTTHRTDGFDSNFQQDDSNPSKVKITVLLYSFKTPAKTISSGAGDILEFTYQTSPNGSGTTALSLENTGVVFSDANAAALPIVVQNGRAEFSTTPPTPIGNVDPLISNLRDTTFTVSWITNVPTTGTIRYGTNPNALDLIEDDQRGGNIEDDTHYVVLQHLQPETVYYFEVVSGTSVDNNHGAYYQQTTKKTTSMMHSDTVYGQVALEDGVTPAVGTIVYLTLSDTNADGTPGQSAVLSALVAETGYWSLNIGNVRRLDSEELFIYSEAGDRLTLDAEGGSDGTGAFIIDTVNDTPAPKIILNRRPESETFTTTLYAGWNLISPALAPVSAPYTDQMFCEEVDQQGGQAVAFEHAIDGNDTQSYSPAMPFSLFSLTLGEGYRFQNKQKSDWTLEGTAASNAVSFKVYQGMTYIGIPHTGAYTAQRLCATLKSQGVAVKQIDRWNDGLESYLCDVPVAADFTIERGQGYIIRASSVSGSVATVTP